MESVEIRTLTIQDYDAMIKLWELAGLPFKPKGRDSKPMIEKQMKTCPEFFVGIFHNEKLVGVVIGSYDGRMKGWINRLAINPAYRRKGIARQLVNAMEKALKKQGVKIFCALIETPNEESLRLFQKLGYVAHKEILYVSKRESEDV